MRAELNVLTPSIPVDWAITTPLLLIDLLLSTALPLSEIFFIIFIDLVMIVTGLVSALVHSQYKWGLFAMGLASQCKLLSLFFQVPS